MIDPTNITKFNCTEAELEETLLFWVCAAGKNAITSSSALNKLLIEICKNKYSPFEAIRKLDKNCLPNLLKKFGIGCYNNKAKTFLQISNSNLNLKNCSLEDLECIYGIGMKTSRCFVIHSRKNANCAGLDVHILKFMNMMGYEVPKSTPNKKEYIYLEKEFLNLVKSCDKSISEIDILIWNYLSGNKDVKQQADLFFDSVRPRFSISSID